MAKMDVKTMRLEIEKFLANNPEPSDEQFHEFARSMGYDPETLESVAYEMLSNEIAHEGQEGDTEQEEELITHQASAAVEAHMLVVARRLKVTATSTHFETGERGEYGEDRPDADDIAAENFDLAVGAPKTKPVDHVETTEAIDRITARLTASLDWGSDDSVMGASGRGSKFADDTPEGFEAVADAGAPGEEGLSEQQEVLQGDQNPQVQDSNSVVLTDGAPVGQNSDDQTQDNLMVDGPLAEAALQDSADQAFMMNDGQPALQLQRAAVSASTRLKASLVIAARKIRDRSDKFAIHEVYDELFGAQAAGDRKIEINTYVDGAVFSVNGKDKARYQQLWTKGIQKHAPHGTYEDSYGAGTWKVRQDVDDDEDRAYVVIRESQGLANVSYPDPDADE